jgi:hypothetical protein
MSYLVGHKIPAGNLNPAVKTENSDSSSLSEEEYAELARVQILASQPPTPRPQPQFILRADFKPPAVERKASEYQLGSAGQKEGHWGLPEPRGLQGHTKLELDPQSQMKNRQERKSLSRSAYFDPQEEAERMSEEIQDLRQAHATLLRKEIVHVHGTAAIKKLSTLQGQIQELARLTGPDSTSVSLGLARLE